MNDIAEYFKTISLWNEEEVKFARKLTQIRNGIAHKNAELVSKSIGDGQKTLLTSIDEMTKKVDAIPYIITTIELIIKIADVGKPAFFSHPRFKGRLEAYSSVIGMVMNLFCDSEFIALPNQIKFTMLNRIFGKTFLLATKDLREKISDYKSKIIEFHDALGGEENRSKQLYDELIKLGVDIFEEMRKDLEIDGDSKVFIKPPLIEIDFKKVKRGGR